MHERRYARHGGWRRDECSPHGFGGGGYGGLGRHGMYGGYRSHYDYGLPVQKYPCTQVDRQTVIVTRTPSFVFALVLLVLVMLASLR